MANAYQSRDCIKSLTVQLRGILLVCSQEVRKTEMPNVPSPLVAVKH